MEVDIKKDLSVHISYRQISYNGIISFVNGELSLIINGNGKYPDGLRYRVDTERVIIIYDDIEKSMDYQCMTDEFVPRILYEFFVACGDTFYTEGINGNRFFIERMVCDRIVQFSVELQGDVSVYSIIIK